ncbi:MAG: hypothetical protein NZ840_13700, partial [Anaerolineales bacterium]|nr:hypothetical protein [Anaerolineales bacterium]MDW8163088.1 hypothetical protein [Anaerolineales bacterium]
MPGNQTHKGIGCGGFRKGFAERRSRAFSSRKGIGAALGVSSIAEQLGAGVWGQLFAAVLSASIPMGILQGSSTQNDC